jgi:hypothetical protein
MGLLGTLELLLTDIVTDFARVYLEFTLTPDRDPSLMGTQGVTRVK